MGLAMREWLESLKVGDKVIVERVLGRPRISRVEKINKASIKVDGVLYNKKNGGNKGGSMLSGYSFIRIATPEEIAKVERNNKTERYVRAIREQLDNGNLPLETLEAIMLIINK